MNRARQEPFAVLRPATLAARQASVADAKRIHREVKAGKISNAEAKKQFDAILSGGDFLFVGYAGNKGSIVDKDGKVLGRALPGDSFIAVSQLERLRAKESA